MQVIVFTLLLSLVPNFTWAGSGMTRHQHSSDIELGGKSLDLTEPSETLTFHFEENSYVYWKVGQGEPIIFIHNAGTSHEIWKDQVEHLSKDHTCYLLDLPGFGKNPLHGKRYPLELYTRFLNAFINHLDENTSPLKDVGYKLIGNCLGSAISLKYTLEHPEKVKRLILFHLLTFNTVHQGILKPVFKLTAHSFRDSELVGRLIESGTLAPEVDIISHIHSFRIFDELKLGEDFPKTTIIWGSKNVVLPLDAGIALSERLMPEHFEIIPGGGHMVMCEMPEAVNAVLDRLLKSEVERVDRI